MVRDASGNSGGPDPDRRLQTLVGQGALSPGRAGASLSPGMIRHAIRVELPPDVFEPQPSRALIAVALIAAIIATDIAILVAPIAILAVLLSILSGALSASLFFLGHECLHGSILKRRWSQDLLAFAAFIIFLLSPTLWRSWHNHAHHVHTNSPGDDPDNFGYLANYRESRLLRHLVALTPGMGRRPTLLYFTVWFTVQVQVVQWYRSYFCRGFAALNRRRAGAETIAMAAFWLVLGWAVGAYGAVLLILLPMMIANAINMSYTATNHLLLPLTGRSNPLADTMSVTTHPLLDRIHFNFSYHVEHHFFPAMSPKFAPLVRAKLHQFAPGQVLAPGHFAALRLLLRTPRMHDANGDLLDPKTGRVVSYTEIGAALRPAVAAPVWVEEEPL
jgi:fatty acid desaturase